MGIINPSSLLSTTPTIPKFYWDVKSQEQRIKVMCCLIQQLIDQYGSTDSQIQKNTEAIEELQELFTKFQESGFDDYYEQQVIKWIGDNIAIVYQQLAKQVFFGLTSDGYFCAYVPDSWSDITFDTGAVYGTDTYGRLILRFDADGSGVIDNTQCDDSMLIDTIDARIKRSAGRGLEFDSNQLNVNQADAITLGGVKLKHNVDNDVSDEWAVTSDGVYSYAPSKNETTDQPTDLTCTDVLDGIEANISNVNRSGKLIMVTVKFTIDAEHTSPAFKTICKLPKWAGSGFGLAVGGNHMFQAVVNKGNLVTAANIPGGTTVAVNLFVNYKG